MLKDAPLPESTRKTTYQLTDGSVSPVRIIDSDEDGIAIEETISCYPWLEKFVDSNGNVCDVIYSTSRTTAGNNEALQYARLKREEWLRAGGLPISECPYAPNGEYKRLLGRNVLASLPKAKPGEKAQHIEPCEGSPEGCKHLHKIRESRLAKNRARVDLQNAQNDSLPMAQIEKLQRAFGAGFRDAEKSAAVDTKRLQGEGEKDK